MSIDGAVNKEGMVHIDNGISLSHKEEWNGPFGEVWIELDTVMQSKVSQKVENKGHMLMDICGIWKKTGKMILFTKQK